MKLKCIRGPGIYPAPAIYDPLCNTPQVAKARGRVELDKVSGARPFTLTILHDPTIRPSHIIEASDRVVGEVWRGVVQSVSHGLEASDNGVFPVTVLRGLRV
jgi:hypothetical protein